MIFIVLLISFLLLVFLYTSVYLAIRQYILPLNQAPSAKYALVLGAGLEKDGSPSDILMDRVLTAAKLFKANKVQYLIMSGSCMRDKDEPAAMQSAACAFGVPESAILIDSSGISTLNSCVNVREKYAPNALLIVTQQFHLTRTILLQRALGVEAVGIPAHLYHFSWHKKAFWYAREMVSLPYNFIKLAFYLH